jgi:hypothetical protein
MSNDASRDVGGGTSSVLHDERLAQSLSQLGADQPRNEIVTSTRREAYDKPHGALRVVDAGACIGSEDLSKYSYQENETQQGLRHRGGPL